MLATPQSVLRAYRLHAIMLIGYCLFGMAQVVYSIVQDSTEPADRAYFVAGAIINLCALLALALPSAIGMFHGKRWALLFAAGFLAQQATLATQTVIVVVGFRDFHLGLFQKLVAIANLLVLLTLVVTTLVLVRRTRVAFISRSSDPIDPSQTLSYAAVADRPTPAIGAAIGTFLIATTSLVELLAALLEPTYRRLFTFTLYNVLIPIAMVITTLPLIWLGIALLRRRAAALPLAAGWIFMHAFTRAAWTVTIFKYLWASYLRLASWPALTRGDLNEVMLAVAPIVALAAAMLVLVRIFRQRRWELRR